MLQKQLLLLTWVLIFDTFPKYLRVCVDDYYGIGTFPHSCQPGQADVVL